MVKPENMLHSKKVTEPLPYLLLTLSAIAVRGQQTAACSEQRALSVSLDRTSFEYEIPDISVSFRVKNKIVM